MKTRYKILILGIAVTIVTVSIFLAYYQEIQLATGLVKKADPEPQPGTLSNEECAELFDKIFDTWEKHVKENYGGPGQPTLEPPTVAGLVSGWEGGEEFRNTDCRYRVNDWAYLVRHQEQVWGYVDWPKLEPFKYEPKPEPVKITGTTAFQICEILKIPCPSEPSFDAFYNSQTNTTTLQYFIKLHKYDFTIDDKRICYTVDGLDYQECPRLKVVIPSTLDGNNSLLLLQTIDEWTQMSEEDLWPYYEKYGDDFFTELGKFLIKNEMKKELERKNIVNKYDDFTVFAGNMLTSLPPHIGYQAVVNATDGKSYLLAGGTYSNTVKSVVSEELTFYDVLEELPIDSLFTQEPLVTILPEDGNKARSDPHDLVIYLDEHNTVTFYNSMSVPVRVQESGSGKVEEEDKLKWKTQIIGPNQTATVSFNATGHYEWDARFPPTPELSGWWGAHTGGSISIISNETSNLEFQEKLRIAGSIIKNSEIPWTGLGMGNNRGLTIDFNSAIFHMLPDATEYYTARAHQLIPFDVPVVIEAPEIELR